MSKFLEKSYLFTVEEALNALKKYPKDAILVDVDSRDGKGYFPSLVSLGKGDLIGHTNYLGILQQGHSFKNKHCTLIDTTGCIGFERKFIPDLSKTQNPGEIDKSKITEKHLTATDLERLLNKMDPQTVLLKKSYFGQSLPNHNLYASPGFLGVYNNESYKLVDEKGAPITMGLDNQHMITFTFMGKSGLGEEQIFEFIKKEIQ